MDRKRYSFRGAGTFIALTLEFLSAQFQQIWKAGDWLERGAPIQKVEDVPS